MVSCPAPPVCLGHRRAGAGRPERPAPARTGCRRGNARPIRSSTATARAADGPRKLSAWMPLSLSASFMRRSLDGRGIVAPVPEDGGGTCFPDEGGDERAHTAPAQDSGAPSSSRDAANCSRELWSPPAPGRRRRAGAGRFLVEHEDGQALSHRRAAAAARARLSAMRRSCLKSTIAIPSPSVFRGGVMRRAGLLSAVSWFS